MADADVGLRVRIIELPEEARALLAGIDDVRRRLAALEEWRARTQDELRFVRPGMTADELSSAVSRARALLVDPSLIRFDDDGLWEAADRRARALERELEGIYVGRRGRRIAGADPDDVWCRTCGRESASERDGSLCGDCGDVA